MGFFDCERHGFKPIIPVYSKYGQVTLSDIDDWKLMVVSDDIGVIWEFLIRNEDFAEVTTDQEIDFSLMKKTTPKCLGCVEEYFGMEWNQIKTRITDENYWETIRQFYANN